MTGIPSIFEKKDTANGIVSVLDVDGTSRRVKVVLSKMGNLDLDGDVIDPTAYNRTIKERGPKGVNLIWHLTDHMPMMKNAIAKFNELFTENSQLVGITDIPKTTWGNDVLEMYKTGNINQHSIGYRTVQSEPVNAGKPNEHRLIKEILLYEGSAVLWGANPETPMLSVGKSLTKEQATEKYLQTSKELNNLAKLFRSGTVSDETFELVEIEIAQKTSILQQLYHEATQPAVKASDPVSEGLLSVLTTFNKTLTTDYDTRRTSSGT